MPIESSTERSNTKDAPTTSYWEWTKSHCQNAHHAPCAMKCDCCAQPGRTMPIMRSTFWNEAENCWATGAALTPYSKSRLKPMTQATSWPSVAYA